jgi:hypothetical protein
VEKMTIKHAVPTNAPVAILEGGIIPNGTKPLAKSDPIVNKTFAPNPAKGIVPNPGFVEKD